ncbi:MAG: AraC family transcriptional regulator [Clostridiaceae bacterium]
MMKFRFNKSRLVLSSLKHFRFNSMFYRIFAATLSIILIVTVLSYVAILYMKNLLTENEIKAQSVYLENNSLYIDSVLTSIKDSTYSIENDDNVKLISYLEDLDNYEYYKMISDIKNKLSMFKITVKEVNNMYIYLNKPGIIIDSAGLNYIKTYYENRYEDNFDSWNDIFKNKFNFSINIWENRIKNDGLYTTSKLNIARSLMDGNTRMGTVVINLNEEFIGKLLVNKEFAEGRKIFMINSDGTIISSNIPDGKGSTLDINLNYLNSKDKGNYMTDEGYLVTYKKSVANNIYYIIFTPKNLFLYQITRLSNIANICIIIFLIAGTLIAFFLSQMLYFPIGSMVEFLNAYSMMTSEMDFKYNEMDFIRKGMTNIVSINRNLENKATENIPIIIDIVLLKIILGGYEINNAISIISQYNIKFSQGFYKAAVIYIENIEKKENTSAKENASQLRSIIKKHFDMRLLSIIKTGEGEYTVITFNDAEDNENTVNSSYIRLHEELSNIYADIGIYIGIGLISGDIFEINKSYKQAVQAINLRKVKDVSRVIEYSPSLDEFAEESAIPCDLELRLHNTITSGNINKTIDYTNEIMNNSYNRNISFASYYSICTCINNLLARLICDRSFDKNLFDKEFDNISAIDNIKDVKLLKELIINNVITLTEYYASKKGQNSVMEKIFEYVDGNFNKDINLESVADKFNFNSNYLSRCFKQIKGISFTDYLNYKKIEMAKKLLLCSNETVKDIAQEAGYNSANFFIRAFQKYEGVTPNEFRKNQSKL